MSGIFAPQLGIFPSAPLVPGKAPAPTTLTHAPTGQVAPDNLVPIINNAATKYGVPNALLTGVAGMETNFGKNVRTSSAGAVGLFQFLPSTARQYGYPLTNTPTIAQAQQQADSAAHYLADLKKRYGDWNTALQHYSGGGYGLAQVQQKAKTSIPANEAVASNIIPSPNLPDVGSALVGIWDSLTTPALWRRVLYFVGGAFLLFWGLKELTGAQIPAMAKRAAVAAAA